jgi:hypothetical protein
MDNLPVDFCPIEKRAYIYLLQEKHELLRKSAIYKMGKTIAPLNEPFNRFAAYRGGVDLQFMCQVPLERVDALENDIKLYFERVFGPPVSGTESFNGDPLEMRRIIAELCFDSFKYPGGIIQGLIGSKPKKSGGAGSTIIVEKTGEV